MFLMLAPWETFTLCERFILVRWGSSPMARFVILRRSPNSVSRCITGPLMGRRGDGGICRSATMSPSPVPECLLNRVTSSWVTPMVQWSFHMPSPPRLPQLLRRRSIERRLQSRGCGRGNHLKESSLCQRSVDLTTKLGANSNKASPGCGSVNHLPACSPQEVCGSVMMLAPPAGLEPATCGLGNLSTSSLAIGSDAPNPAFQAILDAPSPSDI